MAWILPDQALLFAAGILWEQAFGGRRKLLPRVWSLPKDAHDSVRKKVPAIFTELAGDRARMLDGSTFPAGITSTVTAALSSSDATEEQILHADQIAFHLTDWNSDAAFIVALHLFPERFTPEEIEAAVDMFLVRVPSASSQRRGLLDIRRRIFSERMTKT